MIAITADYRVKSRNGTPATACIEEMAVGWADLTHNLWVVARMAEAEKKRKEAQEQKPRAPQARAA